MDVRLRVVAGKNAGQELRLTVPKFFIGRAEDCHLKPRSELISRHHCVLLIEEQSVVIRDLGSRNGTLVNGERIIGEHELKTGDRLAIGPLEFEMLVAQTPKKRPRVTSVKEAVARTASDSSHGELDDVDEWLDEQGAQTAEPPAETVTMQAAVESPDTEEFSVGATTIMPPTPDAPAPMAPVESAVGEAAAQTDDASTPPAGEVPQLLQDATAEHDQQAPSSPSSVPATPAAEEPPAVAQPRKFIPKSAELSAPEIYAPEMQEQPAGGSTDSKSGRKKPGKLPPMPKSSTSDTRSAAADTLRKLFQRR